MARIAEVCYSIKLVTWLMKEAIFTSFALFIFLEVARTDHEILIFRNDLAIVSQIFFIIFFIIMLR